MAARSRFHNQSGEWESMRGEDYNSIRYEAQYPDDDASGGVQLDHCRLYIRNIPSVLNEEGLRTAFSKYGTLTELFLSSDPEKKYGLVKYETPGEAKLAMTKLNRTEPLQLNINIAHKRKRHPDVNKNVDRDAYGSRRSQTEDVASVGSRGKTRKPMDLANGDNDVDDEIGGNEFEIAPMDPDLELELEQIKLKQLELQEEQVRCKQRLLLLKTSKRASAVNTSTNRCILPDGRIVVRNVSERNLEPRDADASFGAGAGDSNERDTLCSCKTKLKSWDEGSEGSSTPSTCVLCSEDSQKGQTYKDSPDKSNSKYTSKKSDYSSKFVESKATITSVKTNDVSKRSNNTSKYTVSKQSDVTSKKLENKLVGNRSEVTYDMMYGDFYSDSDDEVDETNRLIQLRNSDYMDIVEDTLKIVIALAGYPKSKMRLRQMEMFQRCLTDVIDMQLKAGLLKKVPVFLDYYLNRGTIVCICKDLETRNWMVRVNPGLQERMCTNLILLKAKVKRLCLAVLRIPKSCWPATARDAFKLLQYFNPTLKTNMWKIYSQKIGENVETTSFLIDRISGEIIRGPNFKNVIDYGQMDFELTGYTEIYYECLLSDLDEDLSSVASRVKLLEEIKSAENTPRILSEISLKKDSVESDKEKVVEIIEEPDTEPENVESEITEAAAVTSNVCRPNDDIKSEFESSLQKDVLKKLKDVKYIGDKDEVIVWSDETNNYNSDQENEKQYAIDEHSTPVEETIEAPSCAAASDKTESVIESNDNLIGRNSNLNIDSNRGIAYHRRTNYLHVENELKIAITLEGYPQNKLEGTHIRRLKHLFKEYLHKDMKQQRFTNLIIPKFQDVYLSNGAVIYICDSLETKDYLTEVMPKFIHSTGLKLTFRDIKDLVRYTRIVMRLPKEKAHVESLEILLKLQAMYPGLKPDCWKYYSDVAGKQKRQFGVDRESLEIIKRPDFDPVFEGEKLSFRIIDRQKRDVSFEECGKEQIAEPDSEKKEITKKMYVPIDPEITNAPLTRIRTNHYSDLIADDLKLYVGPSNYPESRVDEIQFRTIKRSLEEIVFESYQILTREQLPKFHDMYLFDGVIFIICHDKSSRHWLEQSLATVNKKLRTNLKATEFRGAVGIISMAVKTDKRTDEIIDILQKQNPRLRTKFWRKISTVRTKTKLDAVLQIDKLSAQVITSQNFNKYIGANVVEFKLGHLQSLLKPKSSLEELTKAYTKKVCKDMGFKDDKGFRDDFKMHWIEDDLDLNKNSPHALDKELMSRSTYSIDNLDMDPVIIDKESPKSNYTVLPDKQNHKVFLKIPMNILPDNEDDLNVIFDLLEDKNPGLNTELWEVYTDGKYPSNGRFTIIMDRQSVSVIKGKQFDSTIGGEKLKFLF